MSRTTVGLLVGLVLGYVGVEEGFGAMLVVALVGALGLFVGRALDGDVDLARMGEQLSDAVKRR